MKHSLHATIGVMFIISLFSCSKKIDFPFNKPPVVVAPADTTIKSTMISLSGSATDPDGQVVSYLWSQVSGPASSTIIHSGSANTDIEGLQTGRYVFQLMAVDDEGATGVDSTVVTVEETSKLKTLVLWPANNPDENTLINYPAAGGNGRIDFLAFAWTRDGAPYYGRQLVKFDLSAIPANATITAANLYLFSYPPPLYNGNFQDANFGSNNSMFLQRVTEKWSSTTDWNSPPATTTVNQVVLPHTTRSAMDMKIDMTQLTRDMAGPNPNYGFMMRLQEETIYNCRIFVGSANAQYPAKHPKLIVEYK